MKVPTLRSSRSYSSLIQVTKVTLRSHKVTLSSHSAHQVFRVADAWASGSAIAAGVAVVPGPPGGPPHLVHLRDVRLRVCRGGCPCGGVNNLVCLGDGGGQVARWAHGSGTFSLPGGHPAVSMPHFYHLYSVTALPRHRVCLSSAKSVDSVHLDHKTIAFPLPTKPTQNILKSAEKHESFFFGFGGA